MSDKYAALRASAEGAFSSWSRNMTASTKDILALLAEHDADKRNIEKLRLALRRYSMSAGQADQRKSESIAVRMALGFDADAENVAPVDLCECIEALKNRVAELEARTITVKLPQGYVIRAGHPINQGERHVMVPKDGGDWLSSFDVEHALLVAGINVQPGATISNSADIAIDEASHVTAPIVPDANYQQLSELYHAQEKRLFKIAQRIKGPSFDKYAYSPSQAIDVLEVAIFGESNDDGSAAALNQTHGKQPVSNGQSFGNSEQLNSPVTPDGWIKCSEQLPPDSGFYLVCCGVLQKLSVGYAVKEKGFAAREDITHWQPLPAAPKQESE